MWERLDCIVTIIADVVATISMVLIVGIMFFTTVDVIGRFFDRPILGSYQISELILVWVICLAWPFTTGVRGHVRVEILISRLPQAVQDVIGLFIHLMALGIFILLVWQGIETINFTIEMRELVSIIDIPLYPFQFAVPIGALLTCPILLIQFVKLVHKMKKARK
ncbi:MAG: TRAP transporter small permease [Desulfatiglandales bacterium]|jgi:TRAP-type C4-dicarboxylate transport system permease small subunit|nr:TRAP transporter small permease [Desulfatiglandales bacterium]